MIKLPQFFFAPDDVGMELAAPISVAEIAPASPSPKVEPVSVPAHKGTIKAAETLGLAVPGVQSMKEAGFDDPSEELARMEQSMGKKPRDESGKFVSAAEKTAVKEVDPPKPKPVSKVPKPVVAKPVFAAPVAKVKIGDKEMTPDEITAHIADLEAKAKAPVSENPVVEVPAAEADAAKAKQDEDFYTTAGAAYTPTEAELDGILSGGPEAVKHFSRALARVELSTRKWAQDQLNPILESFDKRLQPLLAHQSQIAQYTKENGFLSANPDIKAHAQGLEESRKVETALYQKRERIQRLISANAAMPEEVEFAKVFDSLTPDQFSEDVATHTRQRLGIKPGEVAAVAPVVPASVVSAPPAPAAKPFNGDRPGGHSTPITESADARALREMNEREGIR